MRILAAVDVNDRADRVVAHVVPWAERFRATLDLAFASEWSTEGQPLPPYRTPEIDAKWAEWNARAEEERVRLDALMAQIPAALRGVPRFVPGRPVDVLPDLVQGYDLLATATHSRKGLERVLVGSVTARLLRNVRTPVLVVGLEEEVHDASGRLRVLAPLSPGEPGGLPWIRDHLGGERVELVHVTSARGAASSVPADRLPYEGLKHEMVLEALLHEEAKTWGFPVTTAHVIPAVSGNPGDAIARLAHDLPADVVVMPTHGRKGLQHLFMGSVAERVVERSPCVVIVLPWGNTRH